MSSDKKPLKSTSARIPIYLDPIISKYAAERGISKTEAIGKIFQVLYPDGNPSAPGDFLREPESTETAEEDSQVAPAPETPEISDTLNQTVRDLTAVKVISQLTKDGNEETKKKKGVLDMDIDDLVKLRIAGFLGGGGESLGGGGSSKSPEIQQLTQVIAGLQEQMGELKNSLAVKDNEQLRERLQKYEDRDKRNEELTPLYDEIGKINNAIVEMSKAITSIGKGSREEPLSGGVGKEILTLATSFKEGIEKMAENVSKGQIGLKDIDSLVTTVEKLRTLIPQAPKDQGELSPTTMAISTAGEIGKELIKEYGKIQRGTEEEEARTPQKEGLVERQVLHYVTRLLESGAAEIDCYAAAKELGVSPAEVFTAVENLKKKELITFDQAKTGQGNKSTGTDQDRATREKLEKLEREGIIISG